MVRARLAVVLLLAGACSPPTWSEPADAARTAEAAQRESAGTSAASQARIQMFTELDSGGIQRVVAKEPADELQVSLVRRHLRDIRDAVLLSGIPGLADLGGGGAPAPARPSGATPGSLVVGYHDVPAGGELTYYSRDTALVAALHGWFDALASDPDTDAVVAHRPGRASAPERR